MKKTLILILLCAMMLLAACGGAEPTDEQMAETRQNTQEEPAPSESAAMQDDEIDIIAIMEDNVFLKKDRNLYFEVEVLSEGEKGNMSVYLTPEKMRVDSNPDSKENIVMVYDFNENTTFFYIPAEKYGATMSDVDPYEEFDYQSEMGVYADSIIEVRRDTLNGWDVIYGEAEIDEGHMQFWYSEEYAMMMKYVVITPEGEEMYFLITHIEMPESVDASVFEKPDNIKFFNLDDDSGDLLNDILDY